jgi:hypothetical protein
MKNKGLITCITVISTLGLLSKTSEVNATIFDDGYYHTINYTISQDVWVRDSSASQKTSLELVAGGIIKQVWVRDNSHFILNSGAIGWSTGDFGGQCLTAQDNGTINILGGTVWGYLGSYGSGKIDIWGGSVRKDIYVHSNRGVSIHGGILNGSLCVNGSDASVKIYGQNFNYAFGEITDKTGTISGTLANGDNIQVSFIRGEGSYSAGSIILIPEPATLLLLGLGAVMVRKKRH